MASMTSNIRVNLDLTLTSIAGWPEVIEVRVEVKCALCALVIRLRVAYTQNDETLGRNSLRHLGKATLPISGH